MRSRTCHTYCTSIWGESPNAEGPTMARITLISGRTLDNCARTYTRLRTSDVSKRRMARVRCERVARCDLLYRAMLGQTLGQTSGGLASPIGSRYDALKLSSRPLKVVAAVRIARVSQRMNGSRRKWGLAGRDRSALGGTRGEGGRDVGGRSSCERSGSAVISARCTTAREGRTRSAS